VRHAVAKRSAQAQLRTAELERDLAPLRRHFTYRPGLVAGSTCALEHDLLGIGRDDPELAAIPAPEV
jgi:hypothetical protein